eukprot:Nk52_evm55s1444 gene=Nk52_evmTU55s1444
MEEHDEVDLYGDLSFAVEQQGPTREELRKQVDELKKENLLLKKKVLVYQKEVRIGYVQKGV